MNFKIAGYCALLFFSRTAAEQWVFWDDTVTHWGVESKEEPIGKAGDKSIGIRFNRPSECPFDLGNAEMWTRFETLEKPSDLPVSANLIIWQWSGGFKHGWSNERLDVPRAGEVIYYQPAHIRDDFGTTFSWPPDYHLLNINDDIVAWCLWKGESSIFTGRKMFFDGGSHNYDGPDLADHTPIVYYTTGIYVPRGDTPVLPSFWEKDFPEELKSRVEFEGETPVNTAGRRGRTAQNEKVFMRFGAVGLTLPHAAFVHAEMFNMAGRKTAESYRGILQPGSRILQAGYPQPGIVRIQAE